MPLRAVQLGRRVSPILIRPGETTAFGQQIRSGSLYRRHVSIILPRRRLLISIFAHTETLEATVFSCCANLLLNRIRFPYFANKTATPQYSVANPARTNIALFGPSPANMLCPNRGSTPESTARRNESEALAEAAREVYVSVR